MALLHLTVYPAHNTLLLDFFVIRSRNTIKHFKSIHLLYTLFGLVRNHPSNCLPFNSAWSTDIEWSPAKPPVASLL